MNSLQHTMTHGINVGQKKASQKARLDSTGTKRFGDLRICDDSTADPTRLQTFPQVAPSVRSVEENRKRAMSTPDNPRESGAENILSTSSIWPLEELLGKCAAQASNSCLMHHWSKGVRWAKQKYTVNGFQDWRTQ